MQIYKIKPVLLLLFFEGWSRFLCVVFLERKQIVVFSVFCVLADGRGFGRLAGLRLFFCFVCGVQTIVLSWLNAGIS